MARKFHEYANNKAFYLGHDALEVYENYHKSINERYRYKYYAADDTAGFEVRLLTISQRIAALIQLCKNVENTSPDCVEIDGDTMNRSIKILDYLDNHHFQEILAYAHSKTGKLTTKNRVENQLKSAKRRSLRTIARNVSPITTEEVRVILDQLINSGWALLGEDGLYSKA